MRKKRRKRPIRALTALALTIVVLGGIGAGYHAPAATSAFFTSESSTQSLTKGSEQNTDIPQSSKSAVQPTKQPKPAPTVPPQSAEDWNLILVNGAHPMQEGYVPELKTADTRGFQFDARAVDSLKQMLGDAENSGLSPIICSSYRTSEKQTALFNNKVTKLNAAGYTQEKAVELAKTEIAYPGTSEHQLGLAADIVALDYQLLDEKQAETPEQVWLMEHCAEYGFILRYPEGKGDVTGVTYEPWHYRYVGKEAAQYITEQGLTLEEYLGQAPKK
ncbi:MAG: M15 family metallopeptidase [Oscillospiraceae bacterium]